jgi:putative flavoprotein involved in K+ transport
MSARELSAEQANVTEERSPERLDVAVVGGGQAGLAMGFYLREQGLRFDIFERGDSIAPAWRERWDSLTLFTPRRYSGLPGLPFPGDPDGYPTRDEVIAYLDRYAETFELPIELDSEVRRLSNEGGGFVLELEGRRATADQVIVATGPFPDTVRPQALPGRRPGRVAGPQHRLPPAGRRA